MVTVYKVKDIASDVLEKTKLEIEGENQNSKEETITNIFKEGFFGVIILKTWSLFKRFDRK